MRGDDMANRSIERQEFSLRLEKRLVVELDDFAKKMGLSRNQLISNCLDAGLDDLRLLNSVGLLVVGKGVRDLVDKIRRGEIKLDDQRELPI